jgi:hypothetical protein
MFYSTCICKSTPEALRTKSCANTHTDVAAGAEWMWVGVAGAGRPLGQHLAHFTYSEERRK